MKAAQNDKASRECKEYKIATRLCSRDSPKPIDLIALSFCVLPEATSIKR